MNKFNTFVQCFCAGARQARIFLSRGVVQRLAAAVILFLVLLPGGAGAGVAFGANRAPADVPEQRAVTTASPEIGGCLPLLKTASHIGGDFFRFPPPPVPVAPSLGAGQAAILGLVLGVRQVVGPAEIGWQKQKQTLPKRDVPQLSGSDNGQAIAIAAYRRCLAQKTLDARNNVLNDWRWTR